MGLPDDYVYWVLIGRKELFGVDSANADDKATDMECSSSRSAKISLDLTKEWDSTIGCLIRLQDVSQCATMPVVSAYPELAAWKPSRHVTLVSCYSSRENESVRINTDFSNS